MELYRTHKVNPLGGCLPMVVQIPIFYALYVALSVSVELQNAPFICFGRAGSVGVDLWICDLAGARSDVHPAAADGRVDVHPAEDDAGDGRSAAGEDDAVHARDLHVHVPRICPRDWCCTGRCRTCCRSPSRSTWSGAARPEKAARRGERAKKA